MESPYQDTTQDLTAPISTGSPEGTPVEGQVNLDAPQPTPDQVNLDGVSPQKIPDAKVATERAVKADIAFGDQSPGVPQLHNEIMTGNEAQLRQRLALAKDIAHRQLQVDMVQGIASERAKNNQPLTGDDVNFIQSLSTEQLSHNPNTILETEFAHQYFNKQAELNDGQNVLTTGMQKDPDGTSAEMDVATNIKSRQEIVKTGIQDLQKEWDNTSWGSALVSMASRFVPVLENYRLHDSKGDSILPGANMEERVQRMWTLPPQDFATQFKKDVDELKQLNPLTAMKYAQSVLAYSHSDALLDSALGIVDVSTIPAVGAGKLAVKGVEALGGAVGRRSLSVANEAIVAGRQEVKQALKDGIKADSSVEMKPLDELVSQGGDITAGAKVSAYQDAVRKFAGQDPLNERSRLTSAVPSLFNISRVLEGSKNLTREAADRLQTALEGNASNLVGAITDTSRINRLEEGSDSLQVGIHNAWDRLKEAYPHLGDAVIDMNHVRAEDIATNAHEVEMQLGKSKNAADAVAGKTERPLVHLPADAEVTLGKPDATLFVGDDANKQADYWAREIYKLNPAAYRVRQQGVGFYISVRAPVDETEDGVRDVLIGTRHETPRGLANTLIGAARTPEDVLSVANRENRHLATHGAQELQRRAKGTADQIGNLPNKSLKRLNTFLQDNRDQIYTEGDKIRRGVYHENVGEFDAAWQARFRKPPTEEERIAYFSNIQLNDWDYTFRNLGIYRDKARQGIERYSFSHKVTDETSGESSIVKTPFIEGKTRKDIPWDDTEDAGIWVYDGQTGAKKYVRKNAATGDERADIINKIQTGGYKVVQTANPLDKTIRRVAESEEPIHFMVVPDTERAALDWKQIERRPGGHVEYQFDHWTKQPTIRRTVDGRTIYEGDQSIFNHATEAEAKKFSAAMDYGRILLKANKIDELNKFLPSNLPYTPSEFRGLFTEATLNNGVKVPARLSLEDPIKHTISGRNILDAHPDVAGRYDNLENEIRSSYNLYGQIDKKYASERDLPISTVKERMGQDGSLFQLEPAKNIDPLTTMNRAMANIMRSRYLNDYKIQSVETFVQEFGDLMKVEGGQAEIRKNPVYYLHNAPWDTQTADKARLAAGKNAQRAILNLLGTQSELGQNIGWAQRDLMNFIYGKGGQKASDWVAEHMLPIVDDPFRYARGIAFHSKLGLFNPVQMFLQAQTITHTVAIAGLNNGMRGLAAGTLMHMLSLTENAKVIDHFASIAAKLGWNKEHFLESYAALKKTGLYNVEGEVALKDDIFDPKLTKGMWGKFLDKGTFFFREGERITRLTSWNTAYREWRVANPAAELDNKALGQILTRQNTLSVNMTRASSSSWQQGLSSIPTQFFAYQARLAEQLLGKRLTTAEKTRAFLTYSAMYGVPTAVGATTFAWPWYDDIRKEALARGINLDNFAMRSIIEGIPSTALTWMTGNEQNYAQRLGPGGVQYFKDIFQDGKVSELFGASPKILSDMVQAVVPVAKAVISPFVPGMGDWKFTSADAIAALEQISTVNNLGKAIYALNVHKFITKNEMDMGPASTADALMTAMIGTSPLRVTDAFLKADIVREQKQMQQAAEQQIITNWRRAMKEFDAGNDGAAKAHLQNMRLLIIGAGFRPDQVPAVMSKMTKGFEDFLVQTNQRFMKSAPQGQYQSRFNQMFHIKPNEEK